MTGKTHEELNVAQQQVARFIRTALEDVTVERNPSEADIERLAHDCVAAIVLNSRGALMELLDCVPRSRADEAYQQGREHESYDHWGAIARAEAENVRLREALRFYADPETYIEGEIPIEKDQGAVARAAITAIGE